MNDCSFMGRVVNDLELQKTDRGISVLNFTIVTKRKFKKLDGEAELESTFLDMEAWDSGAESIAKNFKKGDGILVKCSAKENKWVDREGKQHRKMVFRVNEFFWPIPKKSSLDERD